MPKKHSTGNPSGSPASAKLRFRPSLIAMTRFARRLATSTGAHRSASAAAALAAALAAAARSRALYSSRSLIIAAVHCDAGVDRLDRRDPPPRNFDARRSRLPLFAGLGASRDELILPVPAGGTRVRRPAASRSQPRKATKSLYPVQPVLCKEQPQKSVQFPVPLTDNIYTPNEI